MIEKVAEAAHEAGDDVLFEKYVGGEKPTVAEIKAAIRNATIAMTLFPVICGSRLQEQGRAADARRGRRLPALAARRAADARQRPRRPASWCRASPRTTRRSRALVFKIMTDPFVGQLAFIRVYSGNLKSGDTVLNTTKGMKRAHRPPAEDARQQARGDQGSLRRATSRPRWASRTSPPATPSATRRKPVVLESINFPAPVIALAVEPKTKSDQEKLGAGLAKLMQEDPTFKVETDKDTGQTKISGMGELHLEIIVDRLKREFGVEANVGKPQVAYKETIRKPAKGEGKYIKQTGGRGQYGHAQDRDRAGAGRRLRLRERHHRRLDPQGVHQADRDGHPRGARARHPRRLPGGGRQGEPLRRQLPRRRLLGDGVQDRRLAWRSRTRPRRRARCCSSRS